MRDSIWLHSPIRGRQTLMPANSRLNKLAAGLPSRLTPCVMLIWLYVGGVSLTCSARASGPSLSDVNSTLSHK